MTNLEELYSTDPAFRDIVVEAAAAAIGTTSAEFAEEWLAMDAPGKPVGDVSRENLRVEIAYLENRVEKMREQLGRAADLAGAIMRTCMGGYTDTVDVEAEVVA